MDVAVFSTKSYDRSFLDAANADRHDLTYFEPRLTPDTGRLADGYDAVCAFVNDRLNAEVLRALADGGTRLIALQSAGVNHVDLRAADELGLTVARVPAYSPHAVAEHALAIILTLNRKTNRAYNRVREGNFSLDGLKDRSIGHLGLDVYEEEENLFFENLSGRVIQDDVFARLLTFPNVLITGHQAFFTEEALENIAETTLENVTAFETGEGVLHEVTVEKVA